MSGRPVNALELFGRFRNAMNEPDPFRANEVPVDRGFLAPLATYADGQTELALPAFPLGAIWDGVRSFGAQGFDTPEAIRQNAGAAADAAGGVVMGGLGVGLAGGLADDAVRAAPKVANDLKITRTPGNLFTAFKGGKEVGTFDVREMPNSISVAQAYVDPAYRRQGIASQVYGRIQDETGKALTPDRTLSEDGYAFWKANYPEAVREYVPTIDEPHGLMGYHDPSNKYLLDEVPEWRRAGGPNRPEGVAWSNAPTGSSVPLAGETQDTDPALLEYLRSVGLY
ncbi:MAG: hypothetical protein CTY28_10115 [Hyphomicrobium sp.]|nr:MAG: hypothetical protein CTY28_10115 [Hyphomicrobium sp.]